MDGKVREEAAKLEEPFRTKYLEGGEKHKQQIMGGGSASPNPKPKPTTIEELLESRAFDIGYPFHLIRAAVWRDQPFSGRD